jgi:hypothetical protein
MLLRGAARPSKSIRSQMAFRMVFRGASRTPSAAVVRRTGIVC